MEPKTITLNDLKSYVAQLAPEDMVGECASFTHCLVANAAKWKYPEHYAKVRFDNRTVSIAGAVSNNPPEVVELTPDVTNIALKFDDWEKMQQGKHSPTKAELMEYMPELFTEEEATNA